MTLAQAVWVDLAQAVRETPAGAHRVVRITAD